MIATGMEQQQSDKNKTSLKNEAVQMLSSPEMHKIGLKYKEIIVVKVALPAMPQTYIYEHHKNDKYKHR